jgi:hypothetical protein
MFQTFGPEGPPGAKETHAVGQKRRTPCVSTRLNWRAVFIFLCVLRVSVVNPFFWCQAFQARTTWTGWTQWTNDGDGAGFLVPKLRPCLPKKRHRIA